jgi:hypothetical protein
VIFIFALRTIYLKILLTFVPFISVHLHPLINLLSEQEELKNEDEA